MNEHEWIEKLSGEGFKDLTVCANEANVDFGEHTHAHQTVHAILKGELQLTENGQETVAKAGDRVEFISGTTHSAKTGPEGCDFVVGWK